MNKFAFWLQKGAAELHKQQRVADSMQGCSEKEMLEFKKQREQAYNDQLNRITAMVRLYFAIFGISLFFFLFFFFFFAYLLLGHKVR
jgi:hypothetical protein